MKKLICILLAAATAAGCEKDDPTRYDICLLYTSDAADEL